MTDSWFYVEGDKKIGPVESSKVKDLFSRGILDEETYVWKRGLENWIKLKEAQELYEKKEAKNISDVDPNEKVFIIKIGADRGTSEVEYGPFDMEMLKKLADQKRINSKTYIFVPGMDDWEMIGSTELNKTLFGGAPHKSEEKRTSKRRPFVARLFFHDNEQVYEGVCRDVSVGGLQVLVQDFPGKIGDNVSLNVHPENDDYNFTASGKIVRLLEGGQGFSLRFEDLDASSKQAIQKYIDNE